VLCRLTYAVLCWFNSPDVGTGCADCAQLGRLLPEQGHRDKSLKRGVLKSNLDLITFTKAIVLVVLVT
jgi:hypothetical protein